MPRVVVLVLLCTLSIRLGGLCLLGNHSLPNKKVGQLIL